MILLEFKSYLTLISVCFLLNLTKDLDEDFAEVRFDDIVETTMSAFAEVLLNKRNMKVITYSSLN